MTKGITYTNKPAFVNIHTQMLTMIAMIHLFVIWFLRLNKKTRTSLFVRILHTTQFRRTKMLCRSFQHLCLSELNLMWSWTTVKFVAVVSVDISYFGIVEPWRYELSLEKCPQFFAIKDIYHSTFKLNWNIL